MGKLGFITGVTIVAATLAVVRATLGGDWLVANRALVPYCCRYAV